MNATEIKTEIETLKREGRTNYENCKRLVVLHDALKCLVDNQQSVDPRKTRDLPAVVAPLTVAEAEQWVRSMENADGTVGAHWTMGEADEIRKGRNIDCKQLEFWVAINMMYSDYCLAAMKNNVDTVDFYAAMAKAFLQDPDARKNKLAIYRQCVSLATG